MPPRSRAYPWLLLALLAVTAWSYTPTLGAGFVDLDDRGYLAENPHVSTGLRFENLRWALTGVELSNWHPLTWASHMLDVEIHGLEPAGHHATNVALHLLNVALLFAVLRSLTREAGASLVVAALFALHPMNVESVAWVSQRKTLLSTFFALVSIWSYARYARGAGGAAYASSLILFACSLASKQTFVTLGLVLLLLDFWPLRRAEFDPPRGRSLVFGDLLHGLGRLLPEKLPFFAVSLLAAAIAIQSQEEALSPLDSYGVGTRLTNALLSVVRYLAGFLLPRRLAAFYPLYPEDLAAWHAVAAAALLIGLTALAVRVGLRRRCVLVGWLFFLIMLLPVVGIVQVGMQSMADRYAYVPFWGLSIVVAFGCRELLAGRSQPAFQRAAAAFALALVGLLAWTTTRQAHTWKDSIALFEHAAEVVDRNWFAHSRLASLYFERGDYVRSVEQSRKALLYGRRPGIVRSTYGLALLELGDHEQAFEQLELATIEAPDDPTGFLNLGWLHATRGEYELAIEALARAEATLVASTPRYTRWMIHANQAQVLAKSGQLGRARVHYDAALELTLPAEENLLLRDAARVDLALGEVDSARSRLRRALENDPGDLEARRLLDAFDAPGRSRR
jgi:Tfp pilus assembly protein PilF